MRIQSARYAAFAVWSLVLASPACLGAAYTVFDWNGRTAPTKPAGPPFLPATTNTLYTGAQFYDFNTNSLTPMTVSFTITPLIFPTASSNPTTWTVDSAGTGFTYGYQSPDQAEWRFGTAGAEVQLQISMDFSGSVFNPSFMLMDIDNATSDEITGILARTAGNVTYYPSISLVTGSVVRTQGTGAALMLDSTGGNSTDTQALGSAFVEWSMGGINHLEFTWKGKSGTSIRLSNIYGEYDPAGFNLAVPGDSVPEPVSWAMAGLGLGAVALLRRRA